jgi:hypothetical protein
MIAPEPVVCNPLPNIDGKKMTMEDFEKFKSFMDSFCHSWKEMQEIMDNDEEIAPRRSWKDRFYNNNLHTVYVGHDITASDIDVMVNTMALVCALVLTVPYGITTAAGKGMHIATCAIRYIV